MGVWIEICVHAEAGSDVHVTPCVGVWIEIFIFIYNYTNNLVTPCVGVWIEIKYPHEYVEVVVLSLPAWECGLKSPTTIAVQCKNLSLPAWECGLKSVLPTTIAANTSHSLRGSVD